MTAAVTSRRRWAGRRAGAPDRVPALGLIANFAAISLMVLALALTACAVAGFTATHRNDSRLESERQAALQSALDELHPVLSDSTGFDRAELRLIERRAGLTDLRFDADLSAYGGREARSVLDRQGRIVGWLSWAPDRALSRGMNELWGIAAFIAVLLAIAALVVTRAARRLTGALERSKKTVAALVAQDGVTGLPNRRTTLERLDNALGARRSDKVVFVLIDIDGFRDINDTLGRAGGDTMLASIAERLKNALPRGAGLGRFEDDEFAVIMTDADGQTAATIGGTLAASLKTPLYMDQPWQISATMGLAQSPDDGTTADELYRSAALALRAAKRNGRGAVRRFVPQIKQEHAEQRFLRRELEAAINDNSFDVHYQPVVAAEGGGIVGVEALLRWNHSTRGAVPPSLFIPLAEASGLMNKLGEIVLRRALAEGARWPELFVSVNLSPIQMRSPGLVDLVASILRETGMTASRLTLEVTEGILIDNPEETLQQLEALRALGASTALDDFGSGYSSLNYLQKFPFDRLKIDRAFVASLGTSGNAGAIIQSVVTLGHALGMKVLAEGVETNEQRVLLRLAGCDEMQGFLFAKAYPAESIDKILLRPRMGGTVVRRVGAAAS